MTARRINFDFYLVQYNAAMEAPPPVGFTMMYSQYVLSNSFKVDLQYFTEMQER